MKKRGNSMKKLSIKLNVLAVILSLTPHHVFAEDINTWINDGEAALASAKKLTPNNRHAKNVILFVGDGMGISTITASRIFEGQEKGLDGERNQLSFEKLPYLALSKTYSANQQTSDSAPTMTAIVTGVKTNDGELSVNQSVVRSEPSNAIIQANKVATILEQAENYGMSTGIVSTARITHATPAATYAHTGNRDWEADSNLPVGTDVKDIAAQLIDNYGKGKIGNGIDVVLGGGRTYFLPKTQVDPEYTSIKGRRNDGRDLTKEFQTKFGGEYVWNKAQFDSVNPSTTKKLLGLFEPSHMQYEYDRPADGAGEPSLAEMTEKAIDILKNNKNGYFLMVEGGRIDHASHAGNAYRTLSDTVALSDAVKKAMGKVDLRDTLIIVTADHSHTLTIAGYPKRGNPILGKVVSPGKSLPDNAFDGNPYTTISFANGVGYYQKQPGDAVYTQTPRAGRIEDMSAVNTEDPDFHQEVTVPLSSETHAGEDVAIFAGGPDAHLFHGIQEQSYIYYVMKDALGFRANDRRHDDDRDNH
jgi:alkaline phosphatase